MSTNPTPDPWAPGDGASGDGRSRDREPGRGPLDDLRFTPPQLRRIALMRAVAQGITAEHGDAFVLKGGTALLLAYGLPRYSVDLDLDAQRRGPQLEGTIRRAAEAAGTPIESLNLRKSTETTLRYLLHYGGSAFDPLKIEISYRAAGRIRPQDTTVVDGIRVYAVGRLAELKGRAFVDRTYARDVFDIAFLVKHHPDAIGADLLDAIEETIAARDADHLAVILGDGHVVDPDDAEGVVLELLEGVGRLRRRRS